MIDREARRDSVMRKLALKLWRQEAGQDLIEYALLCAALVVVIAAFLPTILMPTVSSVFSKLSSSLTAS
jgi:Flp pilus assembly pilin Flp